MIRVMRVSGKMPESWAEGEGPKRLKNKVLSTAWQRRRDRKSGKKKKLEKDSPQSFQFI